MAGLFDKTGGQDSGGQGSFGLFGTNTAGRAALFPELNNDSEFKMPEWQKKMLAADRMLAKLGLSPEDAAQQKLDMFAPDIANQRRAEEAKREQLAREARAAAEWDRQQKAMRDNAKVTAGEMSREAEQRRKDMFIQQAKSSISPMSGHTGAASPFGQTINVPTMIPGLPPVQVAVEPPTLPRSVLNDLAAIDPVAAQGVRAREDMEGWQEKQRVERAKADMAEENLATQRATKAAEGLKKWEEKRKAKTETAQGAVEKTHQESQAVDDEIKAAEENTPVVKKKPVYDDPKSFNPSRYEDDPEDTEGQERVRKHKERIAVLKAKKERLKAKAEEEQAGYDFTSLEGTMPEIPGAPPKFLELEFDRLTDGMPTSASGVDRKKMKAREIAVFGKKYDKYLTEEQKNLMMAYALRLDPEAKNRKSSK